MLTVLLTCMSRHHMCRLPREARRESEIPWDWVINSCKHHVSTGNQTCLLREQWPGSLTVDSSPRMCLVLFFQLRLGRFCKKMNTRTCFERAQWLVCSPFWLRQQIAQLRHFPHGIHLTLPSPEHSGPQYQLCTLSDLVLWGHGLCRGAGTQLPHRLTRHECACPRKHWVSQKLLSIDQVVPWMLQIES